MPETLHVEDLCRVFIRAQDAEGRWQSISCEEATDEQFDTWAKSRMEIRGEPGPWGLVERADFCDRLYQAGTLTVLKKGAFEDNDKDGVPL